VETPATFYNSVDQIYHARWVSRRLGRLERMRRLIAERWPDGHPARLVSVTGTSGKGSVCAYLAAALGEGSPVGVYSNPHVFDFRERFVIGGSPVEPDAVTAAWEDWVLPASIRLAADDSRHALTIHEACVLVALELFAASGVSWGVVEASVGGRYDVTRVVDYGTVLLTNVGSDHAWRLGAERWQRALDKAGMLSGGAQLFSNVREPDARAVIADVARATGSRVTYADAPEYDDVERLLADVSPSVASSGLLRGRHQVENARLALVAARSLVPSLDARAAADRMGRVALRGRFEAFGDGVYGDVAHNREKIQALLDHSLEYAEPHEHETFVVGLTGERDAADVLGPILTRADRVIVTSASFKGVDPALVEEQLRSANARGIPLEVEPDPRAAVARAKAQRRPGEIVVVTGSGYVLDQALNPDPRMRALNATWGWRDRTSAAGGPLEHVDDRPDHDLV
jgi:dihydrofolate synthase / folylpolyglutamate synthase